MSFKGKIEKFRLFLQNTANTILVLSIGSFVSACSMNFDPKTLSATQNALAVASVAIQNTSPSHTQTFSLSYGAVKGTYSAYCILENSTAVNQCAFLPGKLPTTYTVNNTQNLKTLSVWVQDLFGNLSDRVDSNAVFLASLLPATPVVAASDPNTASTIHTNHAINNLSITSDARATKWCVMLQAAVSAAPATPAASDACFTSTRPTSITLPVQTLYKVYVFTQDTYQTISSAGVATFDFPVPTTMQIVGPSMIPANGCSNSINSLFYDSYGMLSPLPISGVATLTGAGAGSFYSDAGCTAAITTIPVTAGANSSQKTYFKTPTSGAYSLGGSMGTISNSYVTTVSPVYLTAHVSDYVGGTVCSIFNGLAQCWGENNFGQLGDGDDNNTFIPTPVSGLTNKATSIAIGQYSACAVVDGAASCWGANFEGILGDGTMNWTTAPVTPTGLGSGVRTISVGETIACALVGEAAKCWGTNYDGAIGDGTFVDKPSPTQVQGLTSGVTAVTTGADFACAIMNGGVKCWGSNSSGQLGNNSTTTSNVPVDVIGLTSGVTAIAAGDASACAILTSGGLYCWGSNMTGMLGDGTSIERHVATPVLGMSTGVSSVASSTDVTCAVKNGAAYCWGYNADHALGNADANNISASTPEAVTALTANVYSVSVGYHQPCAVLTTGAVQCWGQNMKGEFGDASLSPVSVPIATTPFGATVSGYSSHFENSCAVLSTGAIQCYGNRGWNGTGLYTSNGFGSNVVGATSGATQVSVGGGETCGIISGDLKCWGGPYLGRGVTNDYNDSPVQPTGLTSAVTAVSLSDNFVCAIQSGAVKCWGENPSGNLGIAAGSAQTSPVATTVTSGATAVAVGESDGSHACALIGAVVKCWGSNAYGELGDGTGVDSVAPVTAVAAGATAIAAAGNATCAVVSGALKCWGYGPMGDGVAPLSDYGTPHTVSGMGSGVSNVTMSVNHACALMTTGAVYCWGSNAYGQIGDGTMIDRSAPVQVVGLSSGVTVLSIEAGHSCAVHSGTFICWGYDWFGMLGDGPVMSQSAPILPNSVSNPAKYTLTGPATSASGSCSTAFTVTLKDATNTTVVAPTGGLTLNLSNGGTGAFYGVAGCGSGVVTSVTMPAGSSSSTFYYKAPSTQEVGPVVTTPRIQRASMKHNAT